MVWPDCGPRGPQRLFRLAAATVIPGVLALTGGDRRDEVEAVWSRIDNLEDFSMQMQTMIELRQRELAASKQEG